MHGYRTTSVGVKNGVTMYILGLLMEQTSLLDLGSPTFVVIYKGPVICIETGPYEYYYGKELEFVEPDCSDISIQCSDYALSDV